MSVQRMSMAVTLAVAVLLLVATPSAVEGSRTLLNLGKLIDHFLDCPPPPALEAPAPEPSYTVPYSDSPPDVASPVPESSSSPVYETPPGPPYSSDSPPVAPISEPSPPYQTPPAGGY